MFFSFFSFFSFFGFGILLGVFTLFKVFTHIAVFLLLLMVFRGMVVHIVVIGLLRHTHIVLLSHHHHIHKRHLNVIHLIIHHIHGLRVFFFIQKVLRGLCI
uniref:Uncharacterized protein n=1 Tax=Anophryoides haemophila TaxID=46462 RepID=A0A7S3IB60_9CILI|mmetsp:Transcript_1335/g.198  ORF Transcript_1335/g.198 Transcript_1335/m.198 type:complete len:101 (+) Transcript_1335:254-556(+)